LLGLIAIRELTKATREVITTSLQPFELWFVCAILYLVLTFSLSMFVQYLERRTQITWLFVSIRLFQTIVTSGITKVCQDELDLTLEKYDICISIVVVNGSDTGKISVFHYAAYASMNVRVCPYF